MRKVKGSAEKGSSRGILEETKDQFTDEALIGSNTAIIVVPTGKKMFEVNKGIIEETL